MTELPGTTTNGRAFAAAPDQSHPILIVMGVSGSGKTTIGKALAERLGWPFEEGDNLHPAADIEKMHADTPLTDADRKPWLEHVAAWIDGWRRAGSAGVITCSALKRSYRDFLAAGRPEARFVYLNGEPELIAARIAARKGHFMPPDLLASQLASLEVPAPEEHAIMVDIASPADAIIDRIVQGFGPEQRRGPPQNGIDEHGQRPTIPADDRKLEHRHPSAGAAPRAAPDLPLAIEDYALIGDCTTAALVGRNGSIDWLCWPRFDSNASFAALLGSARHGRWQIAPADPAPRVHRAYRDGTMVLETVFETAEGEVALIDFMPVGQPSSSVVRLVEGRAGKVTMRFDLSLRFDYGASVPWVTRLEDGAGLTAVAGPNAVVLRTPVKLRGENLGTVAEFTVAEGQCVPFVLTYGPSHLPAPPAFDWQTALQATEAFWRAWCRQCTYQGAWKEPVQRSLLTLKALTYSPTGGIIAAPTTSLPEQIGGPRNWDYRYCWLRDATLTLIALMSAGYIEEARAWRDWLMRSAAGSPEQIQIMYGVAGERQLNEWQVPWLPGYQGSSPVRIGNAASNQLQLDVFGELLDALHQARNHGLAPAPSGWALQDALIRHLETIWEEPDEGIWEVRGGPRHFTYSKVMAWVALDRALRDAKRFGLDAPMARWQALRDRMHATICEQGFDRRRNTFTQSFGSQELDASLLMIPIVGFLPPDDPRVLSTVAAIERELLVDGFVLRYRTQQGVDGLPPGEGAFLPCSFWLADNYALQNRDAEARAVFERLLALRNDVGLLAEEYDPRLKRQLGNFPQAFSHLALVGTALNLHDKGPAQKRRHGS